MPNAWWRLAGKLNTRWITKFRYKSVCRLIRSRNKVDGSDTAECCRAYAHYRTTLVAFVVGKSDRSQPQWTNEWCITIPFRRGLNAVHSAESDKSTIVSLVSDLDVIVSFPSCVEILKITQRRYSYSWSHFMRNKLIQWRIRRFHIRARVSMDTYFGDNTVCSDEGKARWTPSTNIRFIRFSPDNSRAKAAYWFCGVFKPLLSPPSLSCELSSSFLPSKWSILYLPIYVTQPNLIRLCPLDWLRRSNLPFIFALPRFILMNMNAQPIPT